MDLRLNIFSIGQDARGSAKNI